MQRVSNYMLTTSESGHFFGTTKERKKMRPISEFKLGFLFHKAAKIMVKKKVVFMIFYKEKHSLKSIFANS
jgi:hypothetical protein